MNIPVDIYEKDLRMVLAVQLYRDGKGDERMQMVPDNSSDCSEEKLMGVITTKSPR